MATIYEMIEIAEIKVRDEKAKQAGFVIGINGNLYTKTLGRNSAVYIEKLNNQWETWRETYVHGKSTSMNYKVIAVSKEFDYILIMAKGYFNYIQRENVQVNRKKLI